MINSDTIINVLNYEGLIVLPSRNNLQGERVEEGNDEFPSITPMSFSNIKYVNSLSDTFRIGRLKFEKDVEDEVYTALSIVDRENVLNVKEIKEILKDNSLENLKRIDKINSIQLLTRMKQIALGMQVNNENISTQINAVMEDRYQELLYNIKKEDSYLNSRVKEEQEQIKDSQSQKEIDELKAQNQVMMEQMKAMMEQMMKLQQGQSNPNTNSIANNEEKEEKKTTKSKK